MAKENAPIFRKSVKGYNKDDVNSYIIDLNRTLEDNKNLYEKSLRDCNTRAEEDYRTICELTEALSALDGMKDAIAEKEALIAERDAALCEKDSQIEALKATIAELEAQKNAEDAEDERKKTEYYDNLCKGAGEILVIAKTTAEDILVHANDEAQKILGDATTKKDRMLRTLSDSVDAATVDISSYIRGAVDQCIEKINKSVDAAREEADVAASKPSMRFIDGN